MKKQLISIVIASSLLTGASIDAHANETDSHSSKQKQYIGTGIGAVAGALLGGPVGFIAGGLVGNMAAKHDAMDDNTSEPLADIDREQTKDSAQKLSTSAINNDATSEIVIVQAGEIEAIIDDDVIEHSSTVKDILVTDMRFDVFFLSGSTNVEAFYKPQIQTLVKLMQAIPDVDIHLDGFSDRRGDTETNLALSTERLHAVRDELVQAGIDANRIQMNAYGEHQFLSKPGDLEAYSFDRRVVIRFQNTSAVPKNPVALMETATSI